MLVTGVFVRGDELIFGEMVECFSEYIISFPETKV